MAFARRLLPFALALALTVASPGVARADGHPGKTDVFATKAAFSHALSEGVRYDDRAHGFRLQDDAAGGYAKEGRFTLDDLHYGAGFDRVVASWNADCPLGTWIMVELSASEDEGKTWTGWLEAARWGDPELTGRVPKAERAKADPLARINEDTLELKRQGDRLRCRVTLHTERPEVTPLVSLVAFSVVDHAQTLPPDDSRGPAWGREVAADFRSQGAETSDMSYRICGPTSTGMMLTAHGLKLPTRAVAETCWDETNGIYGNWPFIAAGASALMRQNAEALPSRPGHPKAFQAYVHFAPDWKDVEAEILEGRPCVVSINFKAGELKGAPVSATSGHLILVRGFTKTGDVIVNDPAGRTPDKGRVVYDRKQLHAARHGGPVIMFRPYE